MAIFPAILRGNLVQLLNDCLAIAADRCGGTGLVGRAMETQRTLALLREIENHEHVTQRSLSKRLGISLGLANVYLKRLAKKGYIKITTVPSSRLLRYVLTPQGLQAKTRLTYEFARYSYQFIRDARRHMREELERLAERGVRRLVLCGTEELSELAYLAAEEAGLEVVAVVRGKQSRARFLGRAVLPPETLAGLDYDAVIAFSEEDAAAMRAYAGRGKEVLLLAGG